MLISDLTFNEAHSEKIIKLQAVTKGEALSEFQNIVEAAGIDSYDVRTITTKTATLKIDGVSYSGFYRFEVLNDAGDTEYLTLMKGLGGFFATITPIVFGSTNP